MTSSVALFDKFIWNMCIEETAVIESPVYEVTFIWGRGVKIL
jgi:hypothetical protein